MGATLKYYTGSVWTAKPLKYWTGSAWATKQLKYWDGSAWIGAAAAGPPYQDNFDRANANLEASPVASGGWSWVHDGLIAGAASISSNSLHTNTALTTGSVYTAATLSSEDQYLQFTITQVAAGPGSYWGLRMVDKDNFIAIRSRVGEIEVYRMVAGAVTAIYDSASVVVAVNDVVRVEARGTNVTTYKNGAVLNGPTAIGATFASTKVGIRCNAASGLLGDNFECGLVATYADSFDRANANLEASLVASGGWSWTHDGVIAAGFTIASNALKSNTALTTGSAYKAPALFSADQYVQYKVTNITSATGPFACCRLADASNFVGIRTGNGGSNGQIEVYRRVAGSLSSLYTSAASAVALNDIIRLEVSGSTFTVKKNGVVVTGPTAIGGTFAALTPGLVARSSTTMTFDDFEAGTL